MVGRLYLAVYNTAHGLPVVGTHDIVYPDIESALVIGYSRSVATCHIAVCKLVGNDAADIRYGAVIEVSAQYDALSLVVTYIPRHCLCLLLSRLICLTMKQLVYFAAEMYNWTALFPVDTLTAIIPFHVFSPSDAHALLDNNIKPVPYNSNCI